jgi:hypothetical protein
MQKNSGRWRDIVSFIVKNIWHYPAALKNVQACCCEAGYIGGVGKLILQRRNILRGEEIVYETCNAVGL